MRDVVFTVILQRTQYTRVTTRERVLGNTFDGE